MAYQIMTVFPAPITFYMLYFAWNMGDRNDIFTFYIPMGNRNCGISNSRKRKRMYSYYAKLEQMVRKV